MQKDDLMSIESKFIKLSFILIILVTLVHSSSAPDPIYFYATQSGKVTLDQGADGGNPFASVFIEQIPLESIKAVNPMKFNK